MTAERDGGSRRTGQPDLLASLPAENPPASQPAPGYDPAAIEELLTGVRDLREQIAGFRQHSRGIEPIKFLQSSQRGSCISSVQA